MDRVLLRPRGIGRAARLRHLGGCTKIVIDVDGTLTDGTFALDCYGTKTFKTFGPDDHDAIIEARQAGVVVQLVTADLAGMAISQARAEQLDCDIVHCFPKERCLDDQSSVYIGDGWHDHKVFQRVAFGIAPADAFPRTRRAADAVTSRPGGHRAVAQAIEFILRWFT